MYEDYLKLLLKIAVAIQTSVNETGLIANDNNSINIKTLYDKLVTEKILRETTKQLYIEGHYALAVEEAYKCLNNVVKSRSGLKADGADLMRNAFSPKKPILVLNKLKTDSQRDQQLGYMEIFAGSMTGIRNPRAHEHKYLDEPHVALEMLSLANHLLRIVLKAKRSRTRSVIHHVP